MLGFERSKCEADTWIYDAGNCYEYVVTYVDNLEIAVKDLGKLLQQFQGKMFNFKLKGSQLIDSTVHLGYTFACDYHGVLYIDPNEYIRQMEDTYKQQYNDKPNTQVKYPLYPGDHPDLETSYFLDGKNTEIYQSLIGAIQRVISIG